MTAPDLLAFAVLIGLAIRYLIVKRQLRSAPVSIAQRECVAVNRKRQYANRRVHAHLVATEQTSDKVQS